VVGDGQRCGTHLVVLGRCRWAPGGRSALDVGQLAAASGAEPGHLKHTHSEEEEEEEEEEDVSCTFRGYDQP